MPDLYSLDTTQTLVELQNPLARDHVQRVQRKEGETALCARYRLRNGGGRFCSLGVVADVFEDLINSVSAPPEKVDEDVVRTRLDLAHALFTSCNRAYQFILKHEKLRLKSIEEMDATEAQEAEGAEAPATVS